MRTKRIIGVATKSDKFRHPHYPYPERAIVKASLIQYKPKGRWYIFHPAWEWRTYEDDSNGWDMYRHVWFDTIKTPERVYRIHKDRFYATEEALHFEDDYLQEIFSKHQ